MQCAVCLQLIQQAYAESSGIRPHTLNIFSSQPMHMEPSAAATSKMTMDNSPGKGDGSGSSWSTICADVPKFFKFLSDPGLHRLKLPPQFMIKHGHNLPDRVSLTIPSGLLWKVELLHSSGEAWLHKGWERFVEYYSLCLGHFLIFKYVGNGHFEVNIFDTSATEIEYSLYDSLSRDTGSNQVARTEGIESGTELKSLGGEQVQQQTRDGNNRFEAYRRALAFMSEKTTQNPFSIVVMYPSYLRTHNPILHIPPAFAKETLPDNGSSSILLVSEGKSWPVRCIFRKERASFTSGWRKFMEDNDLKVGDACVLEMFERINPTWGVIIFRG